MLWTFECSPVTTKCYESKQASLRRVGGDMVPLEDAAHIVLPDNFGSSFGSSVNMVKCATTIVAPVNTGVYMICYRLFFGEKKTRERFWYTLTVVENKSAVVSSEKEAEVKEHEEVEAGKVEAQREGKEQGALKKEEHGRR